MILDDYVVWHRSSPLINSFNKTKAAIFATQTMLLVDFHFISQINLPTALQPYHMYIQIYQIKNYNY